MAGIHGHIIPRPVYGIINSAEGDIGQDRLMDSIASIVSHRDIDAVHDLADRYAVRDSRASGLHLPVSLRIGRIGISRIKGCRHIAVQLRAVHREFFDIICIRSRKVKYLFLPSILNAE